jgi:hypothetical protein
MSKEIKKAILKESKNTQCNFTKEKVFNIVKEVTLNYCKKKKNSLNPKVKSIVKEEMDNMLEQIKNIDELNLETVLKSQNFEYDNKIIGANDINLDEKKKLILNNSLESISKSEDGKNIKKSQKEENDIKKEDSKPKRSVKSEENNNIIFEDLNNFEDNNKTIERNTSGNPKIKEYSYKCLLNDFNFAIQKGIEEGIFSIEIENNGSLTWPQNKTFLEIDNSKSNIFNVRNIKLDPLAPGEKSFVNIMLNGMDEYKPSKYCIYLDFKVDGKKYEESILINIEVTENVNKIKHKTIIKAFRDDYDFSTSNFSDTIIGNAIEKYKNFENAEVAVFEKKFKSLNK